jgi:hypothetical protein
MIRLIGQVVCASIALVIAYRQQTPHAAFWWTFVACGWLSDATHEIARIARARGRARAAGQLPVKSAILCRHCGHTPGDHLARRVAGVLEWLCYGSDAAGLACHCPGYEPESEAP